MKTLLLLISFLFCVTLNAQKGKASQSSWHEDENGDQKPSSDKYFCLKKEKACYFISNDNANIYIDMKITDVVVQNRILKQGMTIWINMDNKQVKKMGVRFPIGSLNSTNRNKPKLPDDNLSTEASLMVPLSVAKTIELVGFISEEERHFSADNADTFRGSVTYDKGTLFYKLVMPIVKLPVRNSKDHKGAMPFTLGVEYGPPTIHPDITPVLFWIKNIKLVTSK
jgi:hypothetical protein